MVTVFRLLLAILHLSYNLFSSVRRRWMTVRRQCIEFWQGKDTRTEVELLVESVARMRKLPGHLVIILGGEDVSFFFDLVRVIGWCITAGIPCVSFYDHEGLLRKNEDMVRKELMKLKPDLMEYVEWNSTCPVKAAKNGINGTRHKVKVQLLSNSNGKGSIVSLTQVLAKAVVAGVLRSEKIDAELLDDKLRLGEIPNPDLAIVCGDTCSSYGLLPWHIRTTEFFLFPTYHNLTVKDFIYLLEKYAKCEQRFGK